MATRKKSVPKNPASAGASKNGAKSPARKSRIDRHRKIELVAYLRAEKDGFQGDPVEYWLAAEREIDSVEK